MVQDMVEDERKRRPWRSGDFFLDVLRATRRQEREGARRRFPGTQGPFQSGALRRHRIIDPFSVAWFRRRPSVHARCAQIRPDGRPMNQSLEEDRHVEHLDRVHRALETRSLEDVRALFEGLHPAEIALVLESLPPAERDFVWLAIDPGIHAEVFAEAEDAVRAARLAVLDPESLATIAQDVDPDDAADLLQDLPEDVIEEVLTALDDQERSRLESVLRYAEDSAGGLMNLDVVTIRPDVSLEVVSRFLRRRGEIPEKTNRLFVVDRENRYIGSLRLADLLINDPERTVDELTMDDLPAVSVDMDDAEVARLFEQLNLLTAPVVNREGMLLGRITVDDVVDVIRDEGDRSLMNMAGLDEEEDLFAPVLAASRRRALWLAANLATAFVAAWVIGRFEGTIRELVALAVLMPVVASMGGIAGSQTLTIVIRGLALGQIGAANFGALISRELWVGLINAAMWAAVVGLVAGFWFESPGLAFVAGAALAINLVCAALSGAGIPMLLKRLDVDPALAGGVILTTVTDVVGFFALLGLGAWFLVA